MQQPHPDDRDGRLAAFSGWQTVVEIALVFGVFFLQGAWPVPDVNEPYYLGKAIHFWNSDWVRGDFFLETADSHAVFYFTCGWLSLFLTPVVFAWVGRILTWVLLAWGWQRLSVAVVPRRWLSVLSAALMAGLLERFHVAGEWVFGGVEAKGFAYALVFFGLAALVRGQWNRVWLFFGGASCFHVLVGGWSVIAAGFVWLLEGSGRPPLRSMWRGLVGGGILALPGLIPAIPLDWGVPANVVREAHELYVYERLYHHLDLTLMVPTFLFRFAGLTAVFLVLAWITWREPSGRRIRSFVVGALAIALAGGLINVLAPFNRALAAGLLRFYWFRLADAAVPLGVALLLIVLIHRLLRSKPVAGWMVLGVAVTAAAVHLAPYVSQRWSPGPPRSDKNLQYSHWLSACRWIAESGQVPEEARFFTPRGSATFKWYAGRPEVVNWKEIPQDAASMVEWWSRFTDAYGTGSDEPGNEWYPALAERTADQLRSLGEKYDADYALVESWPKVPLEEVYRNKAYAVYRLRGP